MKICYGIYNDHNGQDIYLSKRAALFIAFLSSNEEHLKKGGIQRTNIYPAPTQINK